MERRSFLEAVGGLGVSLLTAFLPKAEEEKLIIPVVPGESQLEFEPVEPLYDPIKVTTNLRWDEDEMAMMWDEKELRVPKGMIHSVEFAGDFIEPQDRVKLTYQQRKVVKAQINQALIDYGIPR